MQAHQISCTAVPPREKRYKGEGFGFTAVAQSPSRKAGAGARVSWDHGELGEQHGTVWSEAPNMPYYGGGSASKKTVPYRHVIPDNGSLLMPGAGKSIPLPLRDLTEHMNGIAASRQGEFNVARARA